MANFATHAVAGAVLGACGGLVSWMNGGLSLPWALTLCGVTCVSSLAPDLDARSSVPARWLWDGIAVGFAAWLLLSVPGDEVGPLRWFVAALCGLLIRGPISRWTMKRTRHRGLFHSLQAALLCGVGVGLILERWTTAPCVARLWIAGAAASGFILHLLLDEAFSVDLNNARVRRSFGSALKVWDARARGLSAGLTGLSLVGLLVFTLTIW